MTSPLLCTPTAACALVLAPSSLPSAISATSAVLGGVREWLLEGASGRPHAGHALLHSMFYDEAISVLNDVAVKDANRAMAHGG